MQKLKDNWQAVALVAVLAYVLFGQNLGQGDNPLASFIQWASGGTEYTLHDLSALLQW